MCSSFENVMKSNKNGRRRSKLMVCFSAELDDQYRELQMALADAMEAEERSKALRRDGESVDSTKRMKPSEPESDKIAQAIAQLMEDNKDSFWDLEFEQARRSDWLDLRAKHAPRDNMAMDGDAFNRETFPRAATALCLVDPEPTDEVLKFLDETLSTGEWDRISLFVLQLNEGLRNVPKAI